MAALDRDHEIDLVSTFMAAHAIPIEYKGRSQEYLDLIVEQMLPKVKEEKLAEFCDIFCEKVSLQQMNLAIFFQKAKEMGFKLRIHADEIESIGGVDVAAELESTSAEHLMVITDEGIQKLAAAK